MSSPDESNSAPGNGLHLDSLLEELSKASSSNSYVNCGPPPPRFKLIREIGRAGVLPLTHPLALALDSRYDMLVLDQPQDDGFRLRWFAEGDITGERIISKLAKGVDEAELLEPAGLAIDDKDFIYIVDVLAGAVKKFSPDGRWLQSFTSAGVSGSPFNCPRDVAVDEAGNLYVADANNDQVVKLFPDGETARIVHTLRAVPIEAAPDELYEPSSVCAVSAAIYIADTNQNRVLHLNAELDLVSVLAGPELFEFPSTVRATGDGRMYVADRGGRRVQRFDRGQSTGLLTMSTGSMNELGSAHFSVNRQGHIVLLNTSRESVTIVDFLES